MVARRAVSVLVLVLLTLAISSGLDLVFALDKAQVVQALSICHDDVWDDGEYCGRDAFVTTGYPDMNHDCVIDGFDVALFLLQHNATGPNLSADLNDDEVVDHNDLWPFFTQTGSFVTPCNTTPLPSSCEGTIALSFNSDSTTIVDNISQGPGVYTAYVVMDNFADARVVEYGIQTSSNVHIIDHRPISGEWLHGCSIGVDNKSIVIALAAPLSSGPANVAMIEYQLTDANPATLTISAGECSYRRVRWSTGDVTESNDFQEVLNAGINGPTPLPTPCAGMIGTIAGRIYEDIGSDCVHVPGIDGPVVSRLVEVNPGGYLAMTDEAGNYSLSVPFGHYTVSLPSNPIFIWKDMSACQVPTYEVDVTTQGTVSGNDFALKPLGTISGKAYSDDGIDCAFTPGADTPIALRTVEVNPGGYLAVTDAYGNYALSVQVGQYTVNLAPAVAGDPLKWVSPCQAPTHSVDVAEQVTTVGNDFPLGPVGVIAGRVYRDFENDCVFNAGIDVPIANRMIEANPGGYIAFTGADGKYALDIPLGQYTVSQFPITNDPWAVQSCQPSSSYVVDVNGTEAGNDFALLLAGSPQCVASVSIVPHVLVHGSPCPNSHPYMLGPCPGVEYEYVFFVEVDPASTISVPAGSVLDITLDPAFTISTVSSDCSISPLSSSGANQRTVQFDSVFHPGHACAVKVRATPTADGPYETNVSFEDAALCTGVTSASLTENDECSCDPNDMAVAPVGCGPEGEIVGGKPLTYTIRFENIGAGRAHNIYVRDVLDADLDLASLHVVTASHAVTGVQVDPGNELLISFDGIELPGTFNPLANNKGYVVFMIDPKPGLIDGTTIENTAEITFDFNEPVVTNTVLNTIQSNPCPATDVGLPPGMPTETILGQNHPNPFNPTTAIEYALVAAERVTISVYNIRGEMIRTLVDDRLPAGWHVAEWNGRDQNGNPVASGVYLYRMHAGSFMETKKFVLLK